MKFSIVLSTQEASFKAATFQGDLDKNLKHIAGLGYDGVELAIRDPAQVDQESMRKHVHQHGLEISAIGTGQAWGEEGLSFSSSDASIRRQAIERIEAHFPLAVESGAVIIIGLIRGNREASGEPELAEQRVIEALAHCARRAATVGARLAVEPISRRETDIFNTSEEVLALIDQVNEPSLGVLLDTYHMNLEEVSMQEAMRTCGDRLFHFHVADSNRMYPGAGELDFAPLMGTLTSMGYVGYVSGEFLPEPDIDTAANRAIVHLKALLEVRHEH